MDDIERIRNENLFFIGESIKSDRVKLYRISQEGRLGGFLESPFDIVVFRHACSMGYLDI